MVPAGKNKAVIAYLTFIGMLIAYFMNREDKHEFATWHIKNMFGLVLLLFISQVVQVYYLTVGEVLWWIAFVSWLFSLIMALVNRKSAIPLLSEKFQSWFTFLD